ncbi:MAG: amidohydrolase [Actinomycetales bacterium]
MDISSLLAPLTDELVAFRRDLHAYPETGRAEVRTTAVVAERLRAAGLSPRLLEGTGLTCDIEPSGARSNGNGRPVSRHVVGLRADLDALPLVDETGTAWASTIPGTAHACGHDMHTTVVLGAGLVLARLAERGELGCGVRLIFQPAEELAPGGALDVIASGAHSGIDQIFAVHCDPHVDVGQVGLKAGAITSASDHVVVRLTGKGGHTSRPHLTGDLVFALGQVITQLPAMLNRRVDPRSGASLVWGRVAAGGPHNAIPAHGEVQGTLRVLQRDAWFTAGDLLREALDHVVAPFDVRAELGLTHGVPPTVNDPDAVAVLTRAAELELGPEAPVPTEQSLGGEDFAWYLEQIPGALARLGTRTPGGVTFDLHRGDYEPDEAAIGVGVRLLVRTVLESAAAHESAAHASAAHASAAQASAGQEFAAQPSAVAAPVEPT